MTPERRAIGIATIRREFMEDNFPADLTFFTPARQTPDLDLRQVWLRVACGPSAGPAGAPVSGRPARWRAAISGGRTTVRRNLQVPVPGREGRMEEGTSVRRLSQRGRGRIVPIGRVGCPSPPDRLR